MDTVVWGHSQGGGAALWTGALARTYAPDVELSGVAAPAPASNLPGLIGNLPNVTGGSVFSSFAVAAYIATYPDVTWRGAIRPGAEPIVRAMSQRCLSGPGVLVSVLSAVSLTRDPDIFVSDPTRGALGKIAADSSAPGVDGRPHGMTTDTTHGCARRLRGYILRSRMRRSPSLVWSMNSSLMPLSLPQNSTARSGSCVSKADTTPSR